MKRKQRDIDYKTYLRLPDLLGAQKPVSAAHDEMLFVIVHQTYELWFKQVLFELDRVEKLFSRKSVADGDLRVIAAGLERVNGILRHLVRQIDILETMTPLDFLDFRHVFRSASGFQSLQFRLLETRLGLRAKDRVSLGGVSHEAFLPDADRRLLAKAARRPALFTLLDRWLARTPFVSMGGFRFWSAYRKAVEDMIAKDRKALRGPAAEADLRRLEGVRALFDGLFDGHGGHWRLSEKALHAALFINLYRDAPVLQQPFRILSALMDLDETMTLWRYRHALMAQRMLGMKTGSGGSSGHDYLVQTTQRHRVFADLFALSTFLIPRSKLPRLPREVEKKMGFGYAA